MDFLLNVERRLSFGNWQACVALEDDFWDCLQSIAEQRRVPLDELAYEVGMDFEAHDLAAALRVFVLAHFQGGAVLSGDPVDEGTVAIQGIARLAFEKKYH